MKISMFNFKAISSVIDYELKPITVLSGTNSSGKSSFIQLLLLLKQTIEIDSTRFQLYLKGNQFKVGNYLDLVKGKKAENKIRVSFLMNKEELKNSKEEIDFFNAFETFNCRVVIEFDVNKEKEFISSFSITFLLPEGTKKEQYINFFNTNDSFSIQTNTGVFDDVLFYNSDYSIQEITYSSIYPTSYSIIIDDRSERRIPKIDGIKLALNRFFKQINYIGPFRELPKDEYQAFGQRDYVGPNGEYTAEVLEANAALPIEAYIITENDSDTISFSKHQLALLDAVKYWICDRFKLCKDIFAIKNVEAYSVIVESSAGVQSTIKHVGFGLSQLLPIIVQGLLMPQGATLILEQPEIHLHPKIQSGLFDFLHSLVMADKLVVIETHSDHLITRMRRRVAEDESNSLKNKINLTFIETFNDDVVFKSIELDEYGTGIFPKDFIENPEAELRPIVKAQMKKRITNK